MADKPQRPMPGAIVLLTTRLGEIPDGPDYADVCELIARHIQAADAALTNSDPDEARTHLVFVDHQLALATLRFRGLIQRSGLESHARNARHLWIRAEVSETEQSGPCPTCQGAKQLRALGDLGLYRAVDCPACGGSGVL